MKLTSPAKLNLILKVIDKLPNNYHLLEMFNVLIDLEDIIEINESNITTIQYDKYKMNTEEDTIYKTIKKYFLKKVRVLQRFCKIIYISLFLINIFTIDFVL